MKTDFTLCRLPEFTEEEKSLIKGTGDFFALNMYSTSIIEHKEFPHEVDWDYLTDRKLEESVDPSWQKGNFVFSSSSYSCSVNQGREVIKFMGFTLALTKTAVV